MERFQSDITARAGELAEEHGVKFDFGKRVGTSAVALDPALMTAVERVGGAIGIGACGVADRPGTMPPCSSGAASPPRCCCSATATAVTIPTSTWR